MTKCLYCGETFGGECDSVCPSCAILWDRAFAMGRRFEHARLLERFKEKIAEMNRTNDEDEGQVE
jgi:formate hydrogenlyase subunit 6/NADH:ubiquinone oxidoreductase subunit I